MASRSRRRLRSVRRLWIGIIAAWTLVGVTIVAAPFAAALVVGGAVEEGSSGNIVCGTEADVVFPLPKGTWVTTSLMGNRNTGGGRTEWHAGHDYGAPMGTPIFASMDGVVQAVYFPANGNNMLQVLYTDPVGQEVWFNYVHSYRNDILVEAGDRVVAGQVIAKVGSSGRSTGPHLHLEMRRPRSAALSSAHIFLTSFNAVQLELSCASNAGL